MSTTWHSFSNFPEKNVLVLPFIHGDKIIYATNYHRGTNGSASPDTSGIFECDMNNAAKHSAITFWNNTHYAPYGSSYIVNDTQDSIIFVGGQNAVRWMLMYQEIAIYHIQTQKLQLFDINITIGNGSKLLLTHNDNDLHILGGTDNNFHIIYDLKKNKSIMAYSFEDINESYCQIFEQGLLYCKQLNAMIMFGGYSRRTKEYLNDFWIVNLNYTKWLIDGYVKMTYENKNYFVPLNYIILLYLGKYFSLNWKRIPENKLVQKLCSFGSVLYNDRVIITFGGEIENEVDIDKIYYIDLLSNNGWKQSKLRLPKPGSCNALIRNKKTIHLTPFVSYADHLCVDISDVLPYSLIATVK
eukprot:286226_1